MNKLFLTTLITLLPTAALAEVRFESTEARVTTIELYTSEGCSSCPPAERWLSRYTQHSELWKNIIPMAFHVDYWNYLGWRDPYASRANSRRQRQYNQDGNLARVYTPGIVVTGEEYRGFFQASTRNAPVPAAEGTPGVLALHWDGYTATVSFEQDQPLIAHLAWLGMDIEQQIRRGENAGKTLTHHFVVLEHVSDQGNSVWTFDNLDRPEGADALVAWVSTAHDQTPLQAAGGPLP